MKYKKSKLGKLDFVEQFLYEKPEEDICRYFRGISVYFKNNYILSIELTLGENEYISYKNTDPELKWLRIDNRGVFPREFYTGEDRDIEYPIIIQRYFKLEDIEKCKQECVEIFDRYVKFFTE